MTRKNVAIIPVMSGLDQSVNSFKKQIKVAAYCRVSTLLEEQESSYEAQIDYYTNYIKNEPKWKLVKIYADEGKTATQTSTRLEFNELIDDCTQGKIDLVLTKSISRFARNTVDLLQAIRKLKSHNVPVIFEKENINTMEATGELLITILSSQAQEESRNISENTQWGVRRRFENGVVMVNHNKFLGYTRDNDGNLIIVEEEAKIVRRIFEEYLSGKSLSEIAKGLERDNIKTVTGKEKWSTSVIDKMLSNEKHCGDLLQQKTYTVNYLTHKREINKGQKQKYFIEDNHEGIVSKDVYHRVQVEKARRSSVHKSSISKRRKKDAVEKSKHSSKFILSNILICRESNHQYRRQVWSKYGVKHAVWRCEDRLKNGAKSSCKHSPTLKETELHHSIMKAINDVVRNDGSYIEIFRENVIRVIGQYSNDVETRANDAKIVELENELLSVIDSSTKMQENDIMIKINELENEIKLLDDKKRNHINQKSHVDATNDKISEMDKILGSINKDINEFDGELVHRLITRILVGRHNELEIQFKCGIIVKV